MKESSGRLKREELSSRSDEILMKKDQKSQVTRIRTGILEETKMKHMEIEPNGWMSTGTSKNTKGDMGHWSALQALKQQSYQLLKLQPEEESVRAGQK